MGCCEQAGSLGAGYGIAPGCLEMSVPLLGCDAEMGPRGFAGAAVDVRGCMVWENED